MSQPNDLHRALLRPSIIHILRAAGFHSTKPSVLDTLTTLAERYLMLLATTTATHAHYSHNDPVPSITDIRMALTDCGALTPFLSAGEEDWRARMRRPMEEIEKVENGGRERARKEKERREQEDLRDVRGFVGWFEGPVHLEMRRVAGLLPDLNTLGGAAGGAPAMGVGGVVQAEDFLTVLKRKTGKAGEDARFVGTALGPAVGLEEERRVVVEGGPVGRLGDWRPPKVLGKRGREEDEAKKQDEDVREDARNEDAGDVSNLSSSTLDHESAATLDHEDAAALDHEDAAMKDVAVEG